MAINLPHDAFMPSGIRVGADLSQPLRDALTHHAGLPLEYQPIIEEGTYDDFKDCIFRACSLRACEVRLEDMRAEFGERKIRFAHQQRHWKYALERQCVTAVEVQLMFCTGDMGTEQVTDFLEFMAKKYGFRYNRLSVNHKACTVLNNNYVTFDPSVEVDMEIVWPYWT